jgi:hypothetical protein
MVMKKSEKCVIRYSQAELDNRSKQLNPNNEAYYKSRGLEKK